MNFLIELEEILKARKAEKPSRSYTAKLFSGGRDRILKKIAEEAGEVIIAAKNQHPELIYESADLLFHLMVLLVHEGLSLGEIVHELKKRHDDC